MATVRSFVAILLDDGVRARLAAAIEELRPLAPGVAWVARDNLHLTLKFLGGVDETLLPSVVSALASAVLRVDPFELVVRGLGAFPTATRPRVLWAGTAAGPLISLAAAVEERLAPLGFPRETRAFSAHVTLGRVREPRRHPPLTECLAECLAAAALQDFGTVRVTRVCLMRSDLSPRGPRYTELAALPLGPV